jgi:hypothetical protein
MVSTLVVLSPNSSNATLPDAPSKLTLLIASIVGARADLASLALASEVLSALMIALAASKEYVPYAA